MSYFDKIAIEFNCNFTTRVTYPLAFMAYQYHTP